MKRVRGGGLGGGAGFVTLILRMQIRSRDGNQRPADRFYGCLCKVPIDNTFALSGRGCVAVVTQGAASLALGYVLLGFQPVLGLLCALSVLFSARSRSAVRSQRTAFSPFPVCCALSADGLKAARLRGLKGQQFHSPGQAKRHPGYCRWRELTPCKGKSLKNHQSLNTNSSL